jgi:hypothetical protein
MLNNAYGQSTVPATDTGKVAERMKAFVEKISSHEGAEFPGSVHIPIQTEFCFEVNLLSIQL